MKSTYEETFLFCAFAASLMTQDAGTIFQDAMSKMRKRVLAQRGDFGPANELINAAAEGMDRAVRMASENLEFRARRGVAYSVLSYLPEKRRSPSKN